MSKVLIVTSENENNFTEEWNSLMDKIQFFNDRILARIFPSYSEFSNIFSGKFWAPASFANLMAKYKNGNDTINVK